MQPKLDSGSCLPADASTATLIGRVFLPGAPGGPSPVLIRGGEVFDLSGLAPTCAALLARDDLVGTLSAARDLPVIGNVDDLLANSVEQERTAGHAHLLAPVDLQAIKACGVTFVTSMLERVIEEHIKGDPTHAEAVRESILEEIGGDIAALKPGSPEAARLKGRLIMRGSWSPYLEVGIGPDPEVFTKAQPMSAVGPGADIGILRESSWNNPEPEVALAVNAAGRPVGATLGNDVNLRDIEGRSALLLGKAKDNNASCALGPFIRLFDDGFSLDDVRRMEITLRVEGDDGFVLEGSSSIAAISRDLADLVAATINDNHQYPDGFVLFSGTMFAPTKDRDAEGQGFTHKPGDVVTVSSPELGALINRVDYCDRIAPWTFGVGALIDNLAARGLIGVSASDR
jgi:fumarylacetoacetate (FAA) hydrolase family protein